MEFKEKVNNWLIKNINHSKTKSNNITSSSSASNYNSNSNKVKHWLSSNENGDNKDNTVLDNSINNLPISSSNLEDIDSLHSVDTAKYILSNNKKTKTRITTMTIKKYCHMSSVNSTRKSSNHIKSLNNGHEVKTNRFNSTNKKCARNFQQNHQNNTIISISSTTDSSDDGGDNNYYNQYHHSKRQQKRTKGISYKKQSYDQRTKFLSIVSELRLRKRSNSDNDNDDEPPDDEYPKRLRKCNFIGRKSKNYDDIRKLLKCTEIRRRNNNKL